MRLVLAVVTTAGRRLRAEPEGLLARGFLDRASVYAPCTWESFPDESSVLRLVDRGGGRVATALVLFDGQGQALSSEGFAAQIGRLRDGGRQRVIVATGPASGWSKTARAKADLLVSLGPMTLPHALAQLVVAEQIYRAFTILAGHPYHGGH